MAKIIFVIISALITFALSSNPREAASVKEGNGREEEGAEPQGTAIMSDNYQGNSALRREIKDLDMAELMNKCNESFRIEMAYLQSLNESGSFLDESDKTPKCFMRCMLESTGVMSEDGDLDPVRAALVFAGERSGKPIDIRDITANCATNRKETCRCEKSYSFMRCVMSMEIDKYGSAQ